MHHHQNMKNQFGHRRTGSKKRCLSQLESTQPTEVFQSVTELLPRFFSNISCQNDYKTKILRNRPHGYLQIFTYHYLVLCFESKNTQHAQVFLDYIYQLIEKPQFELILPETSSQLKQYSAMALKNIISQYLNYMSSGTDTVLGSFKKYPAILQFFVAFFRTLLVLGQICTQYENELEMATTYQFLASYFDIEIKVGQNFVYFNQSKIYVYQQNVFEVYMFYPSDPQQISNFLNNKEGEFDKSDYSSVNLLMANLDQSSRIQPKSRLKEKTKNKPEKKVKKRLSIEQMTHLLNKRRLSAKPKKKEEVCDNSKISYNNVPFAYSKTTNSQQPLEKNTFEKFNVHGIIKVQQNKNPILKEVQTKGQKEPKNDKNFAKHKRHNSQITQYTMQQNQLNSFYNQYKFKRDIQNESKMTNDTSSKTYGYKDNTSDLVDTSETFYRPTNLIKPIKLEQKKGYTWVNKNITKQFTSSFVLQAIPEPYRTNIKVKKQKAREIRKSAGYTGF